MSVLLLMLVAAATPASEILSDQRASSLGRPRWVDATVNVRKTLAEFARCSVRSEPERSREMLLASDVHDNRLVSLAPECLSDSTWSVDSDGIEMSLQPTVVRFIFADAVFARDLTNSDPGLLPTAPQLSQPRLDDSAAAAARAKARTPAELNNIERRYQRDKLEFPYYAFGECIVRSDAPAAKALLSTKVETKEEAQAFDRLLPALAKCQPQKEGQLPLDKADVRGTVAFNYLRLAAATGQIVPKQAKK